MTELELYEILNAPRRTKRNIAVTKAQMEKLRVMMLPSAIRYDKENVQSSPQDPMLIFAEKMDELGREAKSLEMIYMQQYKDVERLVEGLDDTHKDIIKLKYLAEYKAKEIAIELNYSEGTVYKLKREAIKILKDDSKSQKIKFLK